jgi:enoyl-CoA hydratase
MNELVRYALEEGNVATIRLDDGKVNALSLEVFAQLNAALDRAEQDRAVPVIVGREGRFSAGFDLKVLGGGGPDAARLVRTGFELALRMYGFPSPVVVACPGHAVAMGAFLLLAADYRIGARGDFKLGANEVAIGLVLPSFAVELCRLRLAPTYLHRAVEQAEMFGPDAAVAAGFLDLVVAPAELTASALAVARKLAALDRDIHAATKRRVRGRGIELLGQSLAADIAGSS